MRVALLVVFLVVASAPGLAADKPVPKYEGKPLEYWVTQFQKAETEKQRDDAVEALKAFGADAAPALPTFIEMLDDRSANYRAMVIQVLAAIGPKAQGARPVISKRLKEMQNDPSVRISDYWQAIDAMVSISSEPRDAVPDLISLLGKDDWGHKALLTICKIGPTAKEAIPAIRRTVLSRLTEGEKDPMSDFKDLSVLAALGPDVVPLLVEMLTVHGGHGRMIAIGCLEELGPKANVAAPALLKLLKHDDAESRYRAAVMLWKWEKHPLAIPALASVLTAEAKFSTDCERGFSALSNFKAESNVAADAVRWLSEIGPQAKEALPALRETVAIGAAASALARVYYDRVDYEVSGVSYFNGTGWEYRQFIRFRTVADLAQAAQEAIYKIEGKAKK